MWPSRARRRRKLAYPPIQFSLWKNSPRAAPETTPPSMPLHPVTSMARVIAFMCPPLLGAFAAVPGELVVRGFAGKVVAGRGPAYASVDVDGGGDGVVGGARSVGTTSNTRGVRAGLR